MIDVRRVQAVIGQQRLKHKLQFFSGGLSATSAGKSSVRRTLPPNDK